VVIVLKPTISRNKYEWTTDQELYIALVRSFVFTHKEVAISSHHETVTCNRISDSVNRCTFAWGGTFLPPNFSPIRFAF